MKMEEQERTVTAEGEVVVSHGCYKAPTECGHFDVSTGAGLTEFIDQYASVCFGSLTGVKRY